MTRSPDSPLARWLADVRGRFRRYARRIRRHGPAPGRPAPRTSGVDPSPAAPADGGYSGYTARETDEGLRVVADLRGFDRPRRATAIDLADDALLLSVGDVVVGRVPVEGERTSIADVSVNNGILDIEVSVRR